MCGFCCVFFFKQKTAYELRISDWSSDVCSSDLEDGLAIVCVLSAIYPGVFLTKHSEPVDADGVYLVRWPNVTSIRFDEKGLMMGEDVINGAPKIGRASCRERVCQYV